MNAIAPSASQIASDIAQQYGDMIRDEYYIESELESFVHDELISSGYADPSNFDFDLLDDVMDELVFQGVVNESVLIESAQIGVAIRYASKVFGQYDASEISGRMIKTLAQNIIKKYPQLNIEDAMKAVEVAKKSGTGEHDQDLRRKIAKVLPMNPTELGDIAGLKGHSSLAGRITQKLYKSGDFPDKEPQEIYKSVVSVAREILDRRKGVKESKVSLYNVLFDSKR